MWRFGLLYQLLKILCFILHSVGFLRLRYDRAHQRYYQKIGSCFLFLYFPGLLLVLLNFVHLYLRCERDSYNDHLNTLEPNSRPESDAFDFVNQFCQNVAFVWIIIRCLARRQQLWYMVNQAQLTFKHLSSLLRERFALKCSGLLFMLGILQILLLLLQCFKRFWLDWPPDDENGYNTINYAMGAVHLLFAVLLALQHFYHLLHAALLQSLYQSLQQLQLPKELELLRQLLHVQPMLKRMQHLAAFYFRSTFCWLFFMLCFKCGLFVREFTYDENELLQRQKCQDDLEDEAEWMGIEAPPTRDQRLASAALSLTWQLAMLLPLICAAKVQQREHKKLFDHIWKLEFPSSKQEESREVAKDIISFLVSARLTVVDYRPGALSFMAWKPNPNATVIQFTVILNAFKRLLQVVFCTTIVDFVHQMDLLHLQSYLKEHSDLTRST